MRYLNVGNHGKAREVNERALSRQKEEVSMRESFMQIRNSRMGYRGNGLYQLSRYYSSQGVLTVDIGGPRVVGR